MNFKIFLPAKVLAVVLAALFLSACQRDPEIPIVEEEIDYSDQNLKSNVVTAWYELYLEVERYTPGYRPPVSARSLAYIGLTAYESVVPGYSDQYASVANQFSGLSIPNHFATHEYDWEIVLNSAFETAFRLYFENAPTAQQSRIDYLANNLYSQLNRGVDSKVRYRSKSHGKNVANAVFRWSQTDREGHQAQFRNSDPNYIPPGGQGKWSPTYPDYLDALLPHWGSVRTFAASKSDRVKNPLQYSESRTSPLYQEALETYRLVKEIKKGNLEEDRWIADFWSDDCPILTFTPVGRWVSITNQLMKHSSSSIDVALALYAKIGMALHDAGVRSWGEKYRYNYIRPVEYIHKVMGDDDWNTMMCPDGSGRYFTPNFPTYPSGHATFAAAAAEVLTQSMGHYYEMIDKSHLGRTEFIGTPRKFGSFREMAEECGYSRLPIGVHFRMDSEAGIDLGRRIGAKVSNNIKWMKYYN